MKTVKYHKLVRDRIPEIIESSGKICVTEILSDEEYLRMLDEKFNEELAEYHKDQNIEELADLLEPRINSHTGSGSLWGNIILRIISQQER